MCFLSKPNQAHIINHNMEAPDREYFESITWCAKLIDDPNTVVTSSPSRDFKKSTEDSLFAETLKADGTINACLLFYKKPKSSIIVDEIFMLLSLGRRLNGMPNFAHGGILATVIDEAMGSLFVINKESKATSGAVTAYLNTSFIRPVATPAEILVTAKLTSIKGRKYYLQASITDKDEKSLAKGDALWWVKRNPRASFDVMFWLLSLPW